MKIIVRGTSMQHDGIGVVSGGHGIVSVYLGRGFHDTKTLERKIVAAGRRPETRLPAHESHGGAVGAECIAAVAAASTPLCSSSKTKVWLNESCRSAPIFSSDASRAQGTQEGCRNGAPHLAARPRVTHRLDFRIRLPF